MNIGGRMCVRNVGYIPRIRGLYLKHAEFLDVGLLVSKEKYVLCISNYLIPLY
jgi:hypothetical protein